VRMANLCIAVCSKVNGVSRLHGNILKTKTFRDFYVLTPEKFTAVTNGITQRRWLATANPRLTKLLDDTIGKGFLLDYRSFDKLNKYIEDKTFLSEFRAIKKHNKERLAEHVYRTQNVELDVNSVFDVQAKRLHEYKRQMLKALHILSLYNKFCADPNFSLPAPVTFLFGAKAAPGYVRAKSIISLINAIGALVNEDPRTKGKMKVLFLENYGVSLAELLIPATDISEQISTAGREASGTGNMKFMLNGAVTLGTLDGANIEIFERAEKENYFTFGANAEEIGHMEAQNSYVPMDYFNKNVDIKGALNRFTDGSLQTSSKEQLENLYRSLLYGDYDKPDKYFVLYDFDSYSEIFTKALTAYADAEGWSKKAAANTARSGYFSSDRTIGEYNELIWRLRAL
jgi:starch phosphorylase